MVDIFNQLAIGIQGIITHLKVILGGIFGLYLIYVIGQLFLNRKQYKLLKEINQHLIELKEATLKKKPSIKKKRRKK